MWFWIVGHENRNGDGPGWGLSRVHRREEIGMFHQDLFSYSPLKEGRELGEATAAGLLQNWQ